MGNLKNIGGAFKLDKTAANKSVVLVIFSPEQRPCNFCW